MPKHKKKRRQTLESLKEESERKRQEKEKEKLEREAMIKARKEAIEKAELKRKALKGNMFKKTRSGQPVMKYRIQHILDSLLDSEK
jgi:rRNA processing